jgi:quinolinate synthase
MNEIALDGILGALKPDRSPLDVREEIRKRAALAIERVLAIGRQPFSGRCTATP